MYLLKMEKFIEYLKHTKVYRQSALVCRIRLERSMFQYSRDAKLVKEDIVVMDAIGVENVEENEKYKIRLSADEPYIRSEAVSDWSWTRCFKA